MAFKPNFYKQYDYRWSGVKYKGGCTCGNSGCGPTSCANIISALTHKNVTPKDTFKWACKEGYMTVDDGLYWSGIPAMLKHWGITDVKITASDEDAKEALKKGYWLVSLMSRGNWTSGGHFIVVYKYEDGHVFISDSASTSHSRQYAVFSLWAAQNIKMWLVIDPSQYTGGTATSGSKKAATKTTKYYTLYVSDKYVNARADRSTAAKIKGEISYGTKLKLTSYKDGFYKVASGKYKGCYVHKSCLSKYKQTKVTYRLMSEMNLRDGYSTKTKVLDTVSKGTLLRSTKQRGRWAYFPLQKGIKEAGWICIRSKDGKVYLKTVK